MARPSRLTLARTEVCAVFEASPQKVYSEAELSGVLAEHRSPWRLADRTTVADLVNFLSDKGLSCIVLTAEKYRRELRRYVWGTPSVYEVALSLHSRAYLSHATAITLHGLVPTAAPSVYVNVEQSPKSLIATPLQQSRIDQAFSRPQRESNLTYRTAGWTIRMLNGKHSNELGIETMTLPSGETVRVTGLERTLIDIVVRPRYAGGTAAALHAYRVARGRLSPQRLVSMLKRLDYVYPYHQAIGFLMAQAGYTESEYADLRNIGITYDFYLLHGASNQTYDLNWRVYYPRDFNEIPDQ